MPYKLTAEQINRYFCERMRPKLEGQTHSMLNVELLPNGSDIKLTDHKRDVSYLKTTFRAGEGNSPDRVELEINTHKPGVSDDDVISFLEVMIKNDKLFERGEALYGHCVPTETLQREHIPKSNRMACLVIDKKANKERVRKAIYDYMFRPCLYYVLKAAGSFSKH